MGAAAVVKTMAVSCMRLCQTLVGRCQMPRLCNRGRRDKAGSSQTAEPLLQASWAGAGVADNGVGLVVRAISGDVVLEQRGVKSDLAVDKLLEAVSEQTGDDSQCMQLCSGADILQAGQRLGDKVSPPESGRTLELVLLRLPGPPIIVESTSGRPIEVLPEVPEPGCKCHCDRNYRFTALGEFAQKPGMKYILTSNDDKAMASSKVMWKLILKVQAVVYLNFRTEWHVTCTGDWLDRDGWSCQPDMRGTVSSGVPNGPYQGPVYSKEVDPGVVYLMGSNCGEGTYFVFVEVPE